MVNITPILSFENQKEGGKTLEKKHTEFFIATLSIFFMLYSLLILSQNTETSNVISVLMVLSTLIFFLLNFQRSKSKNRTNAICVVIYCFFRTVLDVNRLLTSHGNSVISETVSDILYSSSSIFILVPVALIFVSKLELIDKKQLLIDSIAIAACLYYVLELIFYAALANVRGDITHAHIIFLVLALDIILNTSLFFLFSVFKISFFQKEDTLKIVAIIVICFANSLRVYTSMLQNQYHYIIFMVTYFLFFSVITQTLIFMKDDDTKAELMPKFKIHNIIMSKTTNTILFLFSFVVFIEVLLYYLNVEKNITNIFSVLFAMILYLLSNLNEKNNILEKNTKLAIESEVSIKAYNDMKGEYNKIINMSRIDPLTGLNNRSYMMAVFDELDSEKSLDNFAVFVIDIVQFKTINEITDHKTGDLVLKEIASLLKTMFPDELIFRADSNEFAILIQDKIQDEDQLYLKSQDIAVLLTSPIIFDNYTFNPDIAIGCDRYNENIKNYLDIFKNAEYACAYSKKNFTNSYCITVFGDEIAGILSKKTMIEKMLHKINFEEEFIMYYQPQFDIDGKNLIGVEALLRWYSPKIGAMIPPSDFIPVAEESNIITKLVRFTILSAVPQIKEWNEQYGTNLKMSINLSPKYLNTEKFLKDLKDIINQVNISPTWLEFEITENSLMKSGKKMVDFFEKLIDMGIGVSMDDFGTGYSSLAYLKHFKLTKLKIARELIESIETNGTETKIAEAVITMSEALGITVIAEGVEKKEQRDKLKDLGCDQIQGFLYGRPVPATEFERKYLKKLTEKST